MTAIVPINEVRHPLLRRLRPWQITNKAQTLLVAGPGPFPVKVTQHNRHEFSTIDDDDNDVMEAAKRLGWTHVLVKIVRVTISVDKKRA